MKDAGGRIIYVGKSKALRNRVGSYFEQSADHGPKTKKMVSHVADFDFLLCDTEIEALALENKQIKLHRPKYNIRLKDDKSYPYIRLSKGSPSEWATLTVTRSRRSDKSDKAVYFGPYSGMSHAYGIVDTVRRVLGLPGCKARFPADIGKQRPCLYAQIGQCVAPCAGKITAEGYSELERQAAALLRGNFKQVREELQAQMQQAAEALRFEAAARYRDRIAALERLWEKQKVVGSPDREYDAVAFFEGQTCACLAIQRIREGVIADTEYLLFGGDTITDEEAIRTALYDFYTRQTVLPKEICCGQEVLFGDPGSFTESLGGRLRLSYPERGDKKATVTLLRDNAKQHAEEAERSQLRDNRLLWQLGKLLGLEVLPNRIEAVDISNLGDEQITAGLVLFTDGKPDKRGYRCYKIRSTGGRQDDYASMREAISRRLEHMDTQPLPDLLLLDGGKGHVHTVRTVLEEKGVYLPVFGMVKDAYHKTRTLTDGEGEISIAGEQGIFTLIYKIQEEVHRYTVGRMMQGKRKTLKTSVLTEIPGIGDQKAAALLRAFGGLGALRKAEESEIAAVKGIGKKDAAAVYAALRKQKKGNDSE